MYSPVTHRAISPSDRARFLNCKSLPYIGKKKNIFLIIIEIYLIFLIIDARTLNLNFNSPDKDTDELNLASAHSQLLRLSRRKSFCLGFSWNCKTLWQEKCLSECIVGKFWRKIVVGSVKSKKKLFVFLLKLTSNSRRLYSKDESKSHIQNSLSLLLNLLESNSRMDQHKFLFQKHCMRFPSLNYLIKIIQV